MIVTWLWHYLGSNWVEVTGWSTTLVGIWLTTRRNLWCWPITLVADVIYLIVFYRAQLLSDALLQVFFIVFTIYGWWNWANGVRREGTVRIAPLPFRNAAIAILAGVAGTFVLASVAIRLHASLPYLDAALASFSLVASWWDARRHIANWWLWIVVDTVLRGRVCAQEHVVYHDLLCAAGRARRTGIARLAARAGYGSDSQLNDIVQRLAVDVAAQLVGRDRSERAANSGLEPPMWGVMSRLGQRQSGCPSGNGSGSVTSRAARIARVQRLTSASVCTMGPRAALTRSAPWRIRSN